MHDRTPLSLSRGVARFSRTRRWQFPLFASLAMLATAGCGDENNGGNDGGTNPPPPKYEATIKRTAFGIPHITAKDYASLGFGQGYAFASDHVCTLADQVAKVRSERALYLGTGPGNTYVGSDLAYLSMDIMNKSRAAFEQQPDEVKDMLRGYVAGYNKYVAETAPEALPAPCTNAKWVKPIDEIDLLAYDLDLTLIGGIGQLALAIAAATPPVTGGQSLVEPSLEQLKVVRHTDFGSNGWAIGGDRSSTGRGMVMANPHFPWEGELKLWESQLTVPGQMNIYGVGLMGVPAVLIGFNENIGWTHTFSVGARMTLYGLKLAPGKPTTYIYDGQERAMTPHTYTVQVKLPTGDITQITRTLYSSHYGPIISIPGMAEWTTQSVLTVRDANIDNARFLGQFHAMNKAKNMAEFQAAYSEYQGIPWVNTMSADREGKVWYTDASPTPNLKPEVQQMWVAASRGADPTTAAVWNNLGVVLLDGSTSATEWQNEAGARSPGLVPWAKIPKTDVRSDFVFNANDSYWLANPAAPLTGFSPMHGFEKVAQTPRTRMNATVLMETNGASGADNKFSLEELQAAVFSNRSSLAELTRADVVARCQGQTTVNLNGTNVDISQACSLLGAWNNRFDTDAKGAIIWREFLGTMTTPQLADKGPLFDVAFDPANPIATPNTLIPAPGSGTDPILLKLAQAVSTLNTAKIPLDRTLGETQFTTRTGTRLPIHGGLARDGVTNVVSFGVIKTTVDQGATRGTVVSARTGLTADGYPVNNGSSFVMAMQFTDSGPSARAVLTYSESGDAKSPNFSNQTVLFSQKQWRPILFSEQEIAGDASLVSTTITGG